MEKESSSSVFFFSSRRRHTRLQGDWSSDVCSSDLRVRDFALVAASGQVNARIADAALNRLEVDKLGLDAMDRRYLMMIADIYRGGPVGVETLAAGQAEARDSIEEGIEPFLIQAGRVARTARGRMLNPLAWKHLGLNPPPDAPGPAL